MALTNNVYVKSSSLKFSQTILLKIYEVLFHKAYLMNRFL